MVRGNLTRSAEILVVAGNEKICFSDASTRFNLRANCRTFEASPPDIVEQPSIGSSSSTTVKPGGANRNLGPELPRTMWVKQRQAIPVVNEIGQIPREERFSYSAQRRCSVRAATCALSQISQPMITDSVYGGIRLGV